MDNLDILNADLTTVQTSIPVLKAGVYQATIEEMTIEPNKRGTGDNLNIRLRLDDGGISTADKEVEPGVPIFDVVSLAPTDKYPVERIHQQLKAIREAVLGPDCEGGFAPIDQYLNAQVKVKLKVDPATDQYDEKNRVARYIAA